MTEHYHDWTHHTNISNQLQPGFFIEIPEELAKEKGITNGSRARVISARGSIEGVAMVSRRLRKQMVDGKVVWHIGFPLYVLRPVGVFVFAATFFAMVGHYLAFGPKKPKEGEEKPKGEGPV